MGLERNTWEKVMADIGTAQPSTPARLSVGLVSAGRVGCAVGEALENAGHVVSAYVARSPQSQARGRACFPNSKILSEDYAQRLTELCELIVIAVPDSSLDEVVARLVHSPHLSSAHIVVHTSGAHGVMPLQPIANRGALVAATHPAMTFTSEHQGNMANLPGIYWAVTAASDIAAIVAHSLVTEMGGNAANVEENKRSQYHAALAHGANHVVTLINDSVEVLRDSLSDTVLGDPSDTPSRDEAATNLLAPLVIAAIRNSLNLQDAALTGPVKRLDTTTVAAHIDALDTYQPHMVPSYAAHALRTTQRAHPQSPDPRVQQLIELLSKRLHPSEGKP